MKTIRRWYANICWLLNHPPLGITNTIELLSCDYCGHNQEIIRFEGKGGFKICAVCLKKALDKAFLAREKDGKNMP